MFVRGTDWTKVLLELVLEHENLCLKVAAGGDAGPVLESALDSELQFLQALGTATPQELFGTMPEFMPCWQTTPDADFAAAYRTRREQARRGTAFLPGITSLPWRTDTLCRCNAPTRSA